MRLFLLTTLAMIAFASNSLLCRLALKEAHIDAVTFTCIRIVSGAIALWLILTIRQGASGRAGSWLSGFALFIYAAAFSLAYLSLSAGTGALLLFGAVQATMIAWGLRKGERLTFIQTAGIGLALAGFVALVFPGLAAPSGVGATLMVGAGVAWGIYSLRGRAAAAPIAETAGNFLRATPFALLLNLAALRSMYCDGLGITYAVLSGAVTSGLGYVIWYNVLPRFKAATAATIQLSVPVLTAAGGILLLGERLTSRFLFAASAILGGIALVIRRKKLDVMVNSHQLERSYEER